MNQIKYLQVNLLFLLFSKYSVRGKLHVVDLSLERILKKGNLIATLGTLEKEYILTFSLKPNSYSLGYKNIIHLTIGGNIQKYGDRTPGVWFSPDGSGALFVCSAINGNPNYDITSKPIPLKEWTSIGIYQTRLNGIYTFQVYINGKIIHSVENAKPESFQNVKVYASDPWHDTQDGSIKDLTILNATLAAEIKSFSFHRDLTNEVPMTMSDVIKIPLTAIFGGEALVTYIDPSNEAYDPDACIFACLQNTKCYSLSFSQIGNICMLYDLNIRTNQNYFRSNVYWDIYVL